MANFVAGDDGIERCTKRITVELSREENTFCMERVCRVPLGEDDGGGKDVDDYLAQILTEALAQRMQQFGRVT